MELSKDEKDNILSQLDDHKIHRIWKNPRKVRDLTLFVFVWALFSTMFLAMITIFLIDKIDSPIEDILFESATCEQIKKVLTNQDLSYYILERYQSKYLIQCI